MIDFQSGVPLADAVAQISQRTPLGTRLSSAEWDLVPAEIRLRSLWAARLEDEKIAASMQRKIQQFIAIERTKLAGGGEGVFMDRGLFMEQIRAELKKAGYRPDPKKKGTLQDLSSSGRLGLIWDMNLAQAQGYAHWKTEMDPDLLDASPAWEFVRLENRVERRPWPVKWAKLGGTFYPGDGPYPEGRMIALKTDPIWKALNRFGVPWAPFDWGSGMGTRNVRWREAKRLGVIKDGDPPQVPDKLPFNANVEASLKGISPPRRRAIEDDFLGDVEIEGDVIRLLPPQGDAMGGKPGKKPVFQVNPVDQPAPRPDGTPLAEVLTVGASRKHAEVIDGIRRSIAASDGIHGDGNLPPVKIELRVSLSDQPAAGGYDPVRSRDKLPTFYVNPNAVDAALTAAHETGHLLDNLGFHTPTIERLYASEGQPELAKLMREISRTPAAAELANRFGSGHYLLSPRELFARAYAQYVAEQSADSGMLETLRSIRLRKLEGYQLFKQSQWNWAEFNPVSRAMSEMLKTLGWKSSLP